MEHPLFPGPKSRLKTTFDALARPLTAMPRLRAMYGDPMFLPTVNGDIVMTGRPDLIKRIFAVAPSAYGPFAVQALAPTIGKNSVLVLDGKAHKRERKLLAPPFHGAKMKSFVRTIREVARRRLTEASLSRSATMVDVGQAISLEVIIRVVFGVQETERVARYMDSVVDVIEALHPAFLFAPFLQREFFGMGPYAKFLRKMRVADELLDQQIARRRACPEEGDDILGMLLAARYDDGTPMTDEAIRDELRTVIVAGHETTAMTIAFLADQLFRDPRVLAKAQEEADASDDDSDASAAKLPYLDAVIKETLRMRPILTESLRVLKEPIELCGKTIPAGTSFAASIVLAHFDPETYPEPHRFSPERFLHRTYGPTEFLPFGGGHRRCIGAAFAEMELRVVLWTLLREFSTTLISKPAKPIRRNLTMAPKGGVRVRIEARNARSAASSSARSQPSPVVASDASTAA